MDWRPYYRRECAAPEARDAIARWVLESEDRVLAAAVRRGNVLSFPHTALAYAGPLQARAVRSLFDARPERILALGVLHSGGVEPYRVALDDTQPAHRKSEAFAVVRGAFLRPEREADTPFGPVPSWRVPDLPDVVRLDRSGILDAEFSLDTFLTVCRAGADALGRLPIPVTAAYVGMTRDPVGGSFSTAEELARWVGSQRDAGTAVVTTGDLVHYGTGYGPEWVPGKPSGLATLAEAIRPEVAACLEAALARGDLEEAYSASRRRLLNDQGEILPILALCLGVPTRFALLSFALSDYAPILGRAAPCGVASALVRFGA